MPVNGLNPPDYPASTKPPSKSLNPPDSPASTKPPSKSLNPPDSPASTKSSSNSVSTSLTPPGNSSPLRPLYSPISSTPSSPQANTQFNTEIETPEIGSTIEHNDLPPILHGLLPISYNYIFRNITMAKNGSACSVTFLTNAISQASATQWIADFQERTKTTYRITRGVQSKGKRVLYKTIRHCQHKRKSTKRMLKRPDSIRNKKTECVSTFTLKVYNATASKSIYHTHPCEINLIWDHNHSLECAKVLSWPKVQTQSPSFTPILSKGTHLLQQCIFTS